MTRIASTPPKAKQKLKKTRLIRISKGPYDNSEIKQPAKVPNRAMYLGRSEDYRPIWERACHFRYIFNENEYGYKCYICDSLQFLSDLVLTTVAMAGYLVEHFPGENTFKYTLCNNCYKACKPNNIRSISSSHKCGRFLSKKYHHQIHILSQQRFFFVDYQ